jgi:hypothetical protein
MIIEALLMNDFRQRAANRPFNYLKNIYLDWPDIKPRMRTLYQDKYRSLTVLIDGV